ncbi:MAG: GNAT family N-acetyltransferase [Nostoc sp.]|uniref:GNAT family N-acetyltransferase n=1 Tax=Nostoc sp. TaxID=1180 RepID=UPI002FFD5175
MEIFTLDTSCVLNLLNTHELVDPELIVLLRFGFIDAVKLVVTEQLSAEVIGNPGSQRPEIAQRIGILPDQSVSPQRCAERDLLAKNIFQKFWSNAIPSSRNAEHNYRDCLHLASHKLCGGNVFVTRDETLRKKVITHGASFEITALSPTEAVGRIENELPLLTGIEVLSPVIRLSQPDDKDSLKNLLEPLKDSYLNFEKWLSKTLNDSNACINIASIEKNPISAIAIWKKKDKLTAKLSLFYIAPESRKTGLGQHLLFYCIREWIKNRFEKIIVTTSEQNSELLTFFMRYGFRIEGISQRRYQRADGNSSAEVILAKHCFYRRITEADTNFFTNELVNTVFCVPKKEHIVDNNWFIPPQNLHIQAKYDNNNLSTRLILCDDNNQEINNFAISDLEKLFYPVRFAFKNRQAYLVPIQPRWANKMIQINNTQTQLTSHVHDKIFLRTDNVYYCRPWYAHKDVVGAPILFYISSPESMIGGMGYILERRIALPEDLFLQFGGIGVYQISDIQNHIKQQGSNAGCAMALKFGWWVPFKNPIPRSSFNRFGINGVPQHMQTINYQQYENLMKEGGIEW